jgi:hypothetical protein
MAQKNTPPSAAQLPVPTTLIERRIYLIRSQKIILDSDIADLYQVETRALVQAVKRNIGRFPEDFMFQLSMEEVNAMRSQFVTASKRNVRYQPYAFTEHGVAMLSAVLSSQRAVRIEKLEAAQKDHTSVISILADEINKMKRLPATPPRRPIGFRAE